MYPVMEIQIFFLSLCLSRGPRGYAPLLPGGRISCFCWGVQKKSSEGSMSGCGIQGRQRQAGEGGQGEAESRQKKLEFKLVRLQFRLWICLQAVRSQHL